MFSILSVASKYKIYVPICFNFEQRTTNFEQRKH